MTPRLSPLRDSTVRLSYPQLRSDLVPAQASHWRVDWRVGSAKRHGPGGAVALHPPVGWPSGRCRNCRRWVGGWGWRGVEGGSPPAHPRRAVRGCGAVWWDHGSPRRGLWCGGAGQLVTSAPLRRLRRRSAIGSAEGGGWKDEEGAERSGALRGCECGQGVRDLCAAPYGMTAWELETLAGPRSS